MHDRICILAEGPGVARGTKTKAPPAHPEVFTKNYSPIGSAVWPAIGNIYIFTNVLFYFIDLFRTHSGTIEKHL